LTKSINYWLKIIFNFALLNEKYELHRNKNLYLFRTYATGMFFVGEAKICVDFLPALLPLL